MRAGEEGFGDVRFWGSHFVFPFPLFTFFFFSRFLFPWNWGAGVEGGEGRCNVVVARFERNCSVIGTFW